MGDLVDAIERLERAADAAAHLDPEAASTVHATLTAVRERHGFPGATVVVALVGGTGSGKSSLLNALAGREVAATGVLRPTTETPTALLPPAPEAAVERLLDRHGITRRVGGGLDGVVVVDLPDHDSVERAHPATVDALLPHVDVVLWVLDPLKYNDRTTHDRIAARRRYAEQFLFVLNRVDQLRPDDVPAVVGDLEASLRGDGIPDPRVVTTVAAPPAGPPTGVGEVRDELAAVADRKDAVVAKLRVDLVEAAESLDVLVADRGDAGAADTWAAASAAAARETATAVVGPGEVAASARAGRRTAARAGSGPLGRAWHALRTGPGGRALGLPAATAGDASVLADASDRHVEVGSATLLDGVRSLATALGDPVGGRLRGLVPPDRVDEELRGALAGARHATGPPARVGTRGWWYGVAVLQWLVALAVVSGVGWAWTDPGTVRPGTVPWPVVLVVGGLVVGLALRRLLHASGARAGRRSALDRRAQLATAVEERVRERFADVDRLITDRDRLRDELAGVHGALEARRRSR